MIIYYVFYNILGNVMSAKFPIPNELQTCTCKVGSPHNHLGVRHVGVIWFVFHVLQLLHIRFTKENLCTISNLQGSINVNRIENQTSPNSIMGSPHIGSPHT